MNLEMGNDENAMLELYILYGSVNDMGPHQVSKSSALTSAHPAGGPVVLSELSSFAKRLVPRPGRPAGMKRGHGGVIYQ